MCENNELAATLFDAVQAGIIVVCADTKRIIDINPAACVMIGVSREKICGKECCEYLCAFSCDGCPQDIEDGLEDVENREIVLHRKDGSKIHALLTVVSRIVDDKRLFINSLIDITKQKEIEEQANCYWDKASRLLEDNIIKLKNGGA